MAMRPLEKLPTIRAKLGSTIVLAVATTLLISFGLIAFWLRNSPKDTESISTLGWARSVALGQPSHIPHDAMVVIREPDGNAHDPGREPGAAAAGVHRRGAALGGDRAA